MILGCVDKGPPAQRPHSTSLRPASTVGGAQRSWARLLAVALVLAAPVLAKASSVRAPTFGPNCRVHAELLGFAANERSAALRYRASCTVAAGGRDQLRLTTLVDVASGKRQATFLTEAPVHLDGDHRSLLPRTVLLRRYPALVHSPDDLLGSAAWQRAVSAGKFTAERHDFVDASVRLKLQTPVPVHLAAKNKVLRVKGDTAVGLQVVARLADGNHVNVAAIAPQSDGQLRGALRFAYARGGHVLASLWRDDSGREQVDLLLTPEGVRFGKNEVGLPTVVTGTADEVETLYKSLHPQAAQAWDHVVGEAY